MQQGQALSPVSLMDGSCAANVVRAGNGLGSWVCRGAGCVTGFAVITFACTQTGCTVLTQKPRGH